MARIYGERFENLNSVGGGGQGDIFEVRDILDPAAPVYALKRLRNAERCGRFLQEISALQTIDHPNVIKIIAHSGAAQPGDTRHKYWFVMPLAHDSLSDRAAMYKDNLDGVLSIAVQLADALAAAHQRMVVHRDVKPENILFQRLDNQVWLSDFGICHFGNEKAGFTEPGEVVGPRGFTAPELESGTDVQITGAADIYSLGKVIFFMLSGGGKIAREELNTPAFIKVFEGKGQRYGLLKTLLNRMISSFEARIKSATDVRDELRRIQEWEVNARSLSLSPSALASLEGAQRRAIDQERIRTENNKIRESEDRIVRSVTDNVLGWLAAELKKVQAHFEQDGIHKAEVGKAEWHDPDRQFGFSIGNREDYIAVDGVQFAFMNPSSTFKPKFALKFFVCRKFRMQITIGESVSQRQAVDPDLAVIPHFMELQPPDYRQSHLNGFLKSVDAMRQAHTEFVRRRGGRHVYTTDPLIAKTFIGPPINLLTRFKASEWPTCLATLEAVFSESIKIAIDFSAGNNRSCGA